MKKFLPYILSAAHSLILAFLSWCIIGTCGAIIGGSGRLFVAALLSATLSLAAFVALLVYNGSILRAHPKRKLIKRIEVFESVLLYMPFMSLWECFVRIVLKVIW